ncbi:hypothetical protein K8R04_02010 [Candidatus Uhrbacteria bacterium]|nr:hypothetical protein [Candidatus Uhrbacteria bacterium]
MNKHILFRSFFWLIPRAMVLTVLFYFMPWIEWTPLPDLSTGLSYVYHFLVTYLFARWAFGRHVPTWIDAGVVSAVFIVLGTLLEITIVAWRTGADLNVIGASFSWHSLGIVLVYILAVFLAAWRVRHKQKKALNEVLPTSVRSSTVTPPSSDQLPPAQA